MNLGGLNQKFIVTTFAKIVDVELDIALFAALQLTSLVIQKIFSG